MFLQGQTAITLDGKEFIGVGDLEAQAESVMQCVKMLPQDAGARVEDVCKIAAYVTEHSSRELLYPVIARHLGGVHVASTGLVVKGLARPESDFEVDVFTVAS